VFRQSDEGTAGLWLHSPLPIGTAVFLTFVSQSDRVVTEISGCGKCYESVASFIVRTDDTTRWRESILRAKVGYTDECRDTISSHSRDVNFSIGPHVMIKTWILIGLLWWILTPSLARADLKEGVEAYYFGRYASAAQEFRPLAEQGIAEAQFYLGVMYANGRGVPQNYGESVRWYRLAAEQGFPKAMSNLGQMYSKGKGVPKDLVLAVQWYQGAADEDLPEAQYNLGVMYKEGQGVARDLVQAHLWFNLAGGNGHEDALRARSMVAKMMTPSQIAEAQRLARAWVRKKSSCTRALADDATCR
jgi:TPR repeat protein